MKLIHKDFVVSMAMVLFSILVLGTIKAHAADYDNLNVGTRTTARLTGVHQLQLSKDGNLSNETRSFAPGDYCTSNDGKVVVFDENAMAGTVSVRYHAPPRQGGDMCPDKSVFVWTREQFLDYTR